MARQRRGGSGSFKAPELRGTLGTLLRTTLQQAGAVREALERGAREGRSRLDDLRSNRRRTDALAELGELVLGLIRDGEIDLGELPEARELVRFLDELDGPDAHEHHGHDHDHDHGDHDHDHHDDHDGHDHSHPHHDERAARSGRPTLDDRPSTKAASPSRQRFDSRPAPSASRDDGTVSSGRWSPPKRAAAITKVWRPPVDEAPPADEPAPRRAAMPPNPHRKGGISFDSDDDLEEYMHPDDVPSKPGADGES